MKSRIAYLFTNPVPPTIFSSYDSIPEDAFIIGVDGGTNYLIELNMMPDLIIGDMDSITSETLALYESKVPVAYYPKEKDETDCELAIQWCIEREYREIVIVNTLDGRFDHAMGLIQNLQYAKNHELKARIETANQQIFFLEPGQSIKAKQGMHISLIPFSEIVSQVRTEGLAFPLIGEDLYQQQSRGISNVFNDDTAKIFFQKGDLLAILTL